MCNKHCFRKGNLGFVLKIGYLLRDCKDILVKDHVRSLNDWNNFVSFTYEQEKFENMNLGGRPRYRSITEEDIDIINKMQKQNTEIQEIENYYSYWSIPIQKIY